MIVVKIIGGLGNQMFQYAMGKYLAVKHSTELKLDLSGFKNYKTWKFELDNLNVDYKKYQKNIFKKYVRIQEKHFHFDLEIMDLPDNVHIDGYWQSEKYFKSIRDHLLKDFVIKHTINEANQTILDNINSTNSVSLHVRRGDYITNPSASVLHGTCSLEYYNKAIKHITDNIDNPHFFLFSDDIEWVKSNIQINNQVTAVNINTIDNGYDDLRLMMNCKHNIIANSSFSWWGAWLNNNPEKIVLSPERWFLTDEHDAKDIIPKDWIKL
jgi:hypothetical protein